MRPTNRVFLFALITFLLFGTVPAVNAQPDCTPVTAGTSIEDVNTPVISCADPPICYSDSILEAKVPYQMNYYKFTLGAGQKLIIDVDAQTNDSSLDALLEVFEADGTPFLFNNDQMDKDGHIISLDPYLEFVAPPDGDVTYFIAISAGSDVPTDPDDPSNTGTYTFSLQCSDQTSSPEFKWTDEVGDLLGAIGSDTGSLINITPEDAGSSLPFPLGVGPITDIEFDPSSDLLFVAVDAAVAVDDIPARIVALDPISGNEVASYILVPETGTVVPTVVALEAAGNELYGVQVDPVTERYSLILVTFDDTTLTATLTPVFSFDAQKVHTLAYHQSDGVMYAASGTDLLKIDLASPPVGIPEVVGLPSLFFEIASIDFSHEDVLYVVDLEGNLYEVTELTKGEVKLINPINATGGVSGLTFVVGKPPDVDPIKTICSSTLTSSASASSETAAPTLSRFKHKKNRLRRAIGLFKFEGIEGETVTLNAALEQQESAEAVVEESSASEPKSPWLKYWKGKGRVFLGIRDSIPDVDFRVRKKEQLPLSMSATLPANGTYYVVLIRPLLRFYKADYCLTLESDYEESQAWKTFDVAWPKNESEDDTASTPADESGDVQKSTETVDGGSVNDDPMPVALSTTAIAPTSVPPEEITVEKTGDVPTEEVLPAVNLRDPEPADEDDSEGEPNDAGDTTVEEPVEVTPDEPAAGAGDPEVVQTVGDETTIVEPVAETAVVQEPSGDTGTVETQPADDALSGGETTDEPTAAGDTTVEELVEEVTPEEPVADGGGDTEVVLTDGGGDINEVDEKEPTEALTP